MKFDVRILAKKQKMFTNSQVRVEGWTNSRVPANGKELMGFHKPVHPENLKKKHRKSTYT